MLGTLGFFVAAIIFSLVAYVSLNTNIKTSKFNTNLYSLAHFLAASAFILWGIVLTFDNYDLLKLSVLVGDILLIIGSLLLAKVTNTNKYLLYGSFVLAISFIAIRVLIAPEPFIEDSILIFNSQTVVSIFLALIFIATWLRANLQLGRILISTNGEMKDIWPVWYFTNLVSLVGFCGFIIAKKPQTVALSFIVLCSAYSIMALIIAFNGRKVIKNG